MARARRGEIIDIRRVRIVGERVERPGSPVLERIDVTMTDLVVDRKEKRLQNLGTADASALLLPADIAAFLDARPGLDNVQVTLFPPSEISYRITVRNWRVCPSQVDRRKDSRTTDCKRWPPHHGDH